MLPVAPGMSAQFVPSASQRCHWWPNVIAGVPVHVPLPAVRVRPSVVVPLTDGAAVLAAGSGATSAVGADGRLSLPPAFVAVSTTRMACPTSAGVRS